MAAVVAALALLSCSTGGGEGGDDAAGSPSPSPSPAAVAWSPASPRAVGDGPEVVSGDELVAEAPVVVVADLSDRLDRDVAMWLAAQLQARVVAAPATAPAGTSPSPETSPSPTSPASSTDRVGDDAEVVVAVGDVTLDLPADAELRRVEREARSAAPTDTTVGPLQVRRATTVAERDEPPVAVDLDDVDHLLATAEPASATGTVVLARPGRVPLADVLTAVALGHHVVLTDAADPRADPTLGDALAGVGDEPPVALLGDGWQDVDVEAWGWKLRVAAGEELPGGGQLVYPGRVVVALYGHPVASSLGILGEQPLAETVALAAERAASFEEHVDLPVTPAFEIIATVAAGAPGEHGDYSTRTAIEVLRPYVDAARDAGQLVVLDLQPGRTDFLTQAKEYEELLREPHVGLALDPEWRLAPDEVHLKQIGSVSGHEVNTVVDWLADLVREEALPQKLLVLHQFRMSMITEREVIDTSRDELAVVLHMDGQGPHATKLDTYDTILRDASEDLWIGWKNFHDEDTRMRTPEETMALDPRPVFVSYQ